MPLRSPSKKHKVILKSNDRSSHARRVRSSRRPLVECLERRNLLAAITVDTLADVMDAADGLTSLREAVIESNSNGQADTITLPAGTLTLTLNGGGENASETGDLDITEDNQLTIVGQGSGSTTIDASGLSDRAVDILSGIVSLSGLTISGGVASDTGGPGPSGLGDGGAIFNAGALSLRDVVLDGNTAAGVAGSGGGVMNLGSFTATDSTLSDNIANRAGGAIEDASNDSIVLTNVDLTENVAGIAPATPSPGNGGALHVTGNASVTITGGSVTDNLAAREGGGLWNGSGLMAIDGTLIAGNVASGDSADDGGGGIFNNGGDLVITGAILDSNEADGAAGSGGGIFSTAGDVQITQTTLRFNSANRAGGGIEVLEGNVTIEDNSNLINNDVNGLGLFATTPAPGNGGALHVSGAANVTLIGGSVFGNEARSEGGGLWNGSGLMTIEGTLVESNFVESAGAASDAQGGGGIFNQGGTVVITDATISGNEALDPDAGASNDDGGGGIFNNGGSVTLNETLVTGNFASDGLGNGGAILTLNGDLTINGGVIAANEAARAGGGIESIDSQTNLRDVIVGGSDPNDGNLAGINGGGIHVSAAGDTDIVGGTFGNNIAEREGGGLWNNTGEMTISGSNIVGNLARGDAADDGGGGIFNNGGTLRINAGTLVDSNAATGAAGSGGGVFSLGGTVFATGATIQGNEAVRAGGGIELANNAMLRTSDTDVVGNDVSTADLLGLGLGAAPGNGGGLHVTGPGVVVVSGGSYSGNIAGSEGGGLWNGSGRMTLANVLINNNAAEGNLAPTVAVPGQGQGGGGVFNQAGRVILLGGEISQNTALGIAGSGGGVFNNVGGSLRITDTVISGNTANRAGGGIEDASGAGLGVLLVDVTLEANSAGVDLGAGGTAAPGNGGGLHVTGIGQSLISGGVVTGNVAAAEGGGLWNGAGLMTVTGTSVNLNVASGDAGDQGGGGIFNAGGRLSLERVVISNNSADGASGSGGGLFNDVGGDVKARNTEFSANEANRAGGGIEDNSGAESSVRLIDVDLNGNIAGVSTGPGAPGNGGGLHVSGNGNVSVTRGNVSDNVAASEGGGLWNGSGTMTVIGTVITGNSANGDDASEGGGGLFNAGGRLTLNSGVLVAENDADGDAGSGGGIFNDGGQTFVYNSTVSNNRSNRAGGGIELRSDADALLTVANSTLVGNFTGVVAAPGNGGAIHVTGSSRSTITDSVISGNVAAREGGGLWNDTGIMTVRRTEISGNVASGPAADDGGGGVFNNGGQVNVFGGSISDNIADGTSGSGGGVFNAMGGTFTATGVDISSNTANRAGGGIEDASGPGLGIELRSVTLSENVVGTGDAIANPGNGGGLHVTGPGDVRIVSGVIVGNEAALEGGGLWNGTGSMVVTSSTIDGNISNGLGSDEGGGGIFNNGGSLSVSQSTLADNVDVGGLGDGILSVGGTLTVSSSDFANQIVGIGIIDSESTIRRNTFSSVSAPLVVYGSDQSDDFSAVGNIVSVAGISVRFSEVERVVLQGRGGGDSFDIQPSADTLFAIIGGDDEGSTDVVNVLAAGTLNPNQDDNGDGTGRFTFDNRLPVDYFEIESALLSS